ncbi:hypothetical protein FA13DRAFT_1741051 [Coprinellus micaceus]|jgi:hypothetical protein|uniref:Uncharacterized protein n=1 Tax=Coprinellus micaceus TaxID=71717 RepID=A0A4Y7SKI3_COPMI|nr:hypothetical protein FA13DRAFT_1741051 [Coprinellus micaceus]
MSSPSTIRALPPDPATDGPFSAMNPPRINIDDSSDNVRQQCLSFGALSKPRFLPPKVLPCANVQPSKYFACGHPGSKVCTACRLVSYCSKVSTIAVAWMHTLDDFYQQECQQAHWKSHKNGQLFLHSRIEITGLPSTRTRHVHNLSLQNGAEI